jgi:vanillate O-demethylase ferredoxin subunit
MPKVYCCGPLPLLREALSVGGPLLPGRLHVELFGGEGLTDAPSDPDYTIELARSARRITVPRGQTMLAVLREAGIDMPASCEGGVCLECKTRYLAGAPLHRDLTMPAADRGQFVTPCVSGCSGGTLVLDL